MLALSREHICEKDQLHEEVIRARDRLNAAVQAGDEEAAAEAREELENAYAGVQDWLDNTRTDLEEYFSGRSEKWQDGERGLAALPDRLAEFKSSVALRLEYVGRQASNGFT